MFELPADYKMQCDHAAAMSARSQSLLASSTSKSRADAVLEASILAFMRTGAPRRIASDAGADAAAARDSGASASANVSVRDLAAFARNLGRCIDTALGAECGSTTSASSRSRVVDASAASVVASRESRSAPLAARVAPHQDASPGAMLSQELKVRQQSRVYAKLPRAIF